MITLNISNFRALFVEFENVTTYPDAIITMNWETSTSFISDEDYGFMQGKQRETALNLMTAHLIKLGTIIATGQTPSLISGSSVENVSVSLTPPPLKNQFHYWLNLTPYGSQLLALLQMVAVGGLTVGGRNERSAFRKVGGGF